MSTRQWREFFAFIQKPQMDTNKEFGAAVFPHLCFICENLWLNHFFPSSDDNFSSAFDKSTGFSGSIFCADFSGDETGSFIFASAASFFSSTFALETGVETFASEM